MQDVAESCHRDGPLCADLQFNTYTEYRWRREDNGSDRGIGGRAPKQPHRVYLRVPGLPQDAFQRCRLVRPAGKNCSLRSSWLILWAYVGLLGEPKSFSHGQDPQETKLPAGIICRPRATDGYRRLLHALLPRGQRYMSMSYFSSLCAPSAWCPCQRNSSKLRGQ